MSIAKGDTLLSHLPGVVEACRSAHGQGGASSKRREASLSASLQIRMTSVCFGSGVPVASEEVVDDGGDDEREDDGDEEPADDSDGQGLEHLGSGTQGEGQG